MKRLLLYLFDVERHGDGWDLRVPWPAMRLYYQRKPTAGGVLRQLGVYRLGAFSYVAEWWRSG